MIYVDIVSLELTDVENHSEPCQKKHAIYLIYLKSGLKCPNRFKSGYHQSQNLRPPRPTAPFFVLRVSSAWPRSLVLRGHGQVSPWPWMLPWKLPLPWLWSQPLPWLLMEKWWKNDGKMMEKWKTEQRLIVLKMASQFLERKTTRFSRKGERQAKNKT